MTHQRATTFTERDVTVSAMVPRLLSASREVATDDPLFSVDKIQEGTHV